MATQEAITHKSDPRFTVPVALASRFRPHEMVVFEVVRQVGEVRLWKSTHHQPALEEIPERLVDQYHITTKDELEWLHMRELTRAEDHFYFLIDEQRSLGQPEEVSHG